MMEIYQIPLDKRYWLVRAESGRFYDHFIEHSIIAVGHLNWMNIANTNKGEYFCPNEGELSSSFKKQFSKDDKAKASGNAKYSQVKYFVYEMQVGDWVLTVGDKFIRYGRIISKPYINKKKIEIVYDAEAGRKVEMDCHLRRNVKWGPKISRGKLPFGLVQSLKANQTVCNLDKNWQAIHHSIYPAFKLEQNLYLSAKITSEDHIKNHHISSLFRLLDEIEIIGKERLVEMSNDDFGELYEGYIERDELSSTTKAQFHSPGDIWNTITALAGNIDVDAWAAYTVAGYSMLFGNQKLGFDGIIDLETRKKLWDLVIQRIKSNKAESLVEKLKLELPDADTRALEDDSKDEK